MTVPLPEIREAFRFFLGRRPNPEAPPVFASRAEMVRQILNSREFRTSPRGRKTPLGWPLAQNFVSHRAKVIYCPIGKNACTFLKRQMVRVSDVDQAEYILPDIHVLTDRVCTGLQLSDYPEDEVRRLIADPAYLKVALLRDPVDRLLSAYFEKFVVNRTMPANAPHTGTVVRPVQAAQGLAAPDYDRGITFRDFVEFVTAQDPARLDPHWRPQHLYLQGMSWDRLYPLARLDAMIDMLEERSGRSGLPRMPQNETGSGKGKPHPGAADLLPAEILAAPRISKESYFDAALESAVTDYYSRDLDLLTQSETHST